MRTHRITALSEQALTMWRNAVLGIGDPSYFSRSENGNGLRLSSTTFQDPSKQWTNDEWAGYQLNLPGWKYFDILGNDATTLTIVEPVGPKQLSDDTYEITSAQTRHGWIRCDSLTAPISWHQDVAAFLYAHWDPATPEPHTHWTKASILLARALDNPQQGGGGAMHGWRGYKRLYWEVGDVSMATDEMITQHYMLHLGTQDSAHLLHFSTAETAGKIASQYQQPAFSNGAPFSKTDGCYQLTAETVTANLALDRPVFCVQNDEISAVHLDGDALHPGPDFRVASSADGQLILQLLGSVSMGSQLTVE